MRFFNGGHGWPISKSGKRVEARGGAVQRDPLLDNISNRKNSLPLT